MGYIYAVNRATGRELLACDMCGKAGGVRKRRCPVGYCPPAALCAACNTSTRQTGTWATWHATCPKYHAAYVAQRAAEQAEPDMWARSASTAPDGTVRVVTHAGTIVHVAKDQYSGSVRGFGR